MLMLVCSWLLLRDIKRMQISVLVSLKKTGNREKAIVTGSLVLWNEYEQRQLDHHRKCSLDSETKQIKQHLQSAESPSDNNRLRQRQEADR